MSRRALILALTLAAALALLCVWAFRNPGPSLSSPRLLSLTPQDIKGFTVTHPDGSVTTLFAAPNPDDWLISFLVPGQDIQTWSPKPERVRGIFRLLADAKSLGSLAPEGHRRGTTVALAVPLAPPPSISFEPTGLGGRTATEVFDGTSTRRVLVDSEFAALFEQVNMSEWRDPSVLLDSLPEPARISIASGSETISLARVGKNWSLRRQTPMGDTSIGADPRAATELLARFASLSFTQFESLPATPATQEPRWRVTIETDQPGAGRGSSRRVVTQELSFFQESGSLLVADVRTFAKDDRPAPLVVRGAARGRINPDDVHFLSLPLETFVDKRACDRPPADVARVTLSNDARSAEFIRAGPAWHTPAGAATPQDAARVEALLALTCQANARFVSESPPEAPIRLATILVASSNSPWKAEMELVAESSSSPAPGLPPRVVLVVKTGEWWRTYEHPDAEGFIAWIKALIN